MRVISDAPVIRAAAMALGSVGRLHLRIRNGGFLRSGESFADASARRTGTASPAP